MINWRIINKYSKENNNYRYKCLAPQEALMYRWGRVSTSEVERKWACWQYRWKREEHGCEKGKDRGREGINVLVREKVREEERKIGSMYVSVCMCLCVCVCICVCVMYLCLCVCVCVMYLCVCVCACACICVCACACICVCKHEAGGRYEERVLEEGKMGGLTEKLKIWWKEIKKKK